MVKFTPRHKKWLTVISMILLSASTITAPIDLKGMLPEWATQAYVGAFSLVNLAAYGVLIGAYWVITKQTE